MNHDCLVAFGSNEGESKSVIENVVECFQDLKQITEFRSSATYTTFPVGGPSGQRDYLNACFRFRTELDPVQLFDLLVGIETELGRERRQRWGSRKIDLDLLLHGHGKCFHVEADLEVPHPRMTFRRFVLEPAVEIAGDMVHCVAGMTLSELLEHIESSEDRIRLLSDRDHSSIGMLRTICQDLGWEFSSCPLSPVASPPAAAKLNVYFRDECEMAERQIAGKGPLLKLVGQNTEKWHLEIAAAISAISNC